MNGRTPGNRARSRVNSGVRQFIAATTQIRKVSLMRLISSSLLVILTLSLSVLDVSWAKSPGSAVENAQLPNGNWTWKKPDPEEPGAKTMFVKKTGEAVSIRINNYEVPISAQRFLESVREKIMAKPDYAGAEVQLVSSREVNGKTWNVFGIRRKDEINQEIWGRKIDGEAVFMVIFTGAGTYYDQYHSDLMSFLKASSR